MMKKTSKKGEPLLSVNNEQFDNYKEISPQSSKKKPLSESNLSIESIVENPNSIIFNIKDIDNEYNEYKKENNELKEKIKTIKKLIEEYNESLSQKYNNLKEKEKKMV